MQPPAVTPIAVTMGEPAGIGIEIAIKAWARREARELPPFFLLADPAPVREAAARLSDAVGVVEIDRPGQAAGIFADALPVLPVPLAVPVQPGTPDPANADAVLSAIRQAVDFCRRGEASAVVTNPIQKATLYEAGFNHPGHTEFLAELCESRRAPVMMLACPGLRTVPVTVHVPLTQAIASLSTDLIVDRATTTAEALRRDFGIAEPVLAIAGLNPHAGEAGTIGHEDRDIIVPAVEQLRAAGLEVRGPMAADAMFASEQRRGYDAAICMYHDQALIPIKTLQFDAGVNLTLGLPVVRTSPDHGTALGIAGQGVADAGSLLAAIVHAGLMARRRAQGG